MSQYFRKLLLAIVIITLTIILFYLFFPSRLNDETTIIIEPKASTNTIANQLIANDIIKNKFLFIFFSKLYALYSPIKSGEYNIKKNSSIVDILNTLSSGKSVIHKIVLPEGITVTEVVNALNSISILQGSLTTPIDEGTLMPSTYFYSYGDNRNNLISIMQSKMSKILDEASTQLTNTSPIKNKHELLVLASIIEKETSIEQERSLVAAVFLNRLKKGMKLQADPTTIYAITLGKYKLERALTKKDLTIQSPYNTYYINRLPPAPICCPGKKSIEAVIHPAQSEALYFVADGNGGHNFSETLNEHIKNIEKYKANNIHITPEANKNPLLTLP